jgi:hypothetical protein
MSVSFFALGATSRLKTTPAASEKSDLLKLAFCSKPIIKFIAGTIATPQIKFIGAVPDFFVTRYLVLRFLFRPVLGRCRA